MTPEIQEYIKLAPYCVPAILVLMFVVKQYAPLKKWIPVISLVLGVGLVFVTNAGWDFGLNLRQIVVVGLLFGGTPVGLYEGGKAGIEAIKG